jgi:hypothetical protein
MEKGKNSAFDGALPRRVAASLGSIRDALFVALSCGPSPLYTCKTTAAFSSPLFAANPSAESPPELVTIHACLSPTS